MIFPIERIVTAGLRNDDALATLNLILDRGGSEFEAKVSYNLEVVTRHFP